MKRITKMILSAMLIGVLFAGLVFAQGGVATSPSTQTTAATTTSTQTVAPEVKDALLEALTGSDGEYAAYAMYSAVIDTYGNVEPYVTIREAEARHIAALERQLDKYGIEYPSENPYLGTVEAPASLQEAAIAWAEGEVANVELYDRLIATIPGSSYPDIVRVLNNLRSASLDAHLPAFQAAADNGGTLSADQMQNLDLGHGGNGAGNGGRNDSKRGNRAGRGMRGRGGNRD
jgi:hypothetical protein